MRPWLHALGVVLGIGIPVAVTFSSSRTGPQFDRFTPPREVLLNFERMAFDERQPEAAVRKYFSPDVVDHDPNVRGDRDSIIERLSKLDWSTGGPQRTIMHVVVDGDIVAVHHHLVRKPGEAGIAAVDLFRIKDGLVVEHWDVLQPIPEDSPNTHGMF